MIKRRKSKTIEIGGIKIGGNNPITVQSMCNTDTRDVLATVKQIKELQELKNVTHVSLMDHDGEVTF